MTVLYRREENILHDGSRLTQWKRVDVGRTTCVYANGVTFTFDVLAAPPEGAHPSDLIVWKTMFEDGQEKELTMNAQEAIDIIVGLSKCVQSLIGNNAPLHGGE